MTEDLVDTALTTPDAVEDPSEHSVRNLPRLGWITFGVGILLWVLLFIGLSVTWAQERMKQVPAGQTWVADTLQFTAGEIIQGPFFSPEGEVVQATPGAAYIVVSLNYQASDPDVEYSCSFDLLGKNRQWRRTFVYEIDLSTVVTHYQSNCDTSEDGIPITQGMIAEIFEIPQTAVDEIQAVRLTVFPASNGPLDFETAWDSVIYETVMKIR